MLKVGSYIRLTRFHAGLSYGAPISGLVLAVVDCNVKQIMYKIVLLEEGRITELYYSPKTDEVEVIMS